MSRERATLGLAFAWGLAEATLFFVVPDVLLSFIAMRRLRLALAASAFAVAGALAGGAVMYELGRRAPADARTILVRVPGIDAELLASVRAQLDLHGDAALFRGLARGRPYKIFAVERGAASSDLGSFLAVSAAARGIRFAASAVVARLVLLALGRWVRDRRKVEVALASVFWLAFYAAYFAVFGW